MKYIIGILLFTTSSLQIWADDSDERLKEMFDGLWEDHKVSMLSAIINDKGTMTVIGWQEVHYDDGTLREMRTIELSIIMPASKDNSQYGEDDEDEKYEDLKTIFKTISDSLVNVSASNTYFDKEGEKTTLHYVDEDNIYIFNNGVGYLNKTIRVTDPKVVEDRIKMEKDQGMPPAVLRYDVNGNFKEHESTVVPEYMAYIEESEDATKEMMDVAISAVTMAYLKSPENITYVLGTTLQNELPEFNWHVTSDGTGEYINKDVSMTVIYELTPVDADVLKYQIFGVHKNRQ